MAAGEIDHSTEASADRRLRDEFRFFVGWANAWGMHDNWHVFACELHAAVSVALRLEARGDADDAELLHVAAQHRRLALLLEELRADGDLDDGWARGRSRLWAACVSSLELPGISASAARLQVADEPPEGLGIPIRLVPWMERTQFQRSTADVRRDVRADDWPALRGALAAGLEGALGLNAVWVDRDPRVEATRVEEQRRRLLALLDVAHARFDPTTQWEELRELLWSSRDELVVPDAHG